MYYSMLCLQASEAKRTEELERAALEKEELLEVVRTMQRETASGCMRQFSRDTSSA